MKRTVRLLALLFALILSTVSFAHAEDIDLSGLSYDELVALKNRINLAMWQSEEWQEVTVPQGVWVVGEDIPAGHWTVKCANGWYTEVSWGEHLSDSGESISWYGRYSIMNMVYNPDSVLFDEGDLTEYSFEVHVGEYIVINSNPAVFTPYTGKPDLGFK